VERCHFVGLSMGGMTALGLALNHADVIDSMAVCNSLSTVPGPDWVPLFEKRRKIAETDGMEPLVDPTVERWFTAELRASAPPWLAAVCDMIRGTDPVGYAGCLQALQKIDYYPRLDEIKIPTLLIAGAQDVATPPKGMRAIEEEIAGARYVELDPAAHLSNLEQPEAFNAALGTFLAEQVS
jgi:3-oxoadipate enol-lactonase